MLTIFFSFPAFSLCCGYVWDAVTAGIRGAIGGGAGRGALRARGAWVWVCGGELLIPADAAE